MLYYEGPQGKSAYKAVEIMLKSLPILFPKFVGLSRSRRFDLSKKELFRRITDPEGNYFICNLKTSLKTKLILLKRELKSS